jgi:glycosyltransferase involved in cell wall biosynthesis
VNWPKISIVTPSYNQGKYIEQTILSVINQNYPNLEYIIIDGGSTDETVEIIKRYEKHITYWVSEKDNGQSHAINKGLEKCTGDIFNWLNSDDWYESDALFTIAREFMKDSSVLFVSGYENHIYDNGNKILYNGTFLKERIAETIELCEVTQPSTFFKLDTINRIGMVSNDLHYVMDGELWVRLLLMYGQNNFRKINKVLVNFRYHIDSKSFENISMNHFLIERASIIVNLQKSVDVPLYITESYVNEIYKSPSVKNYKSTWLFNDFIISKRDLKLYFIKKFINKQFIFNNLTNVGKGVWQLIRLLSIDWFFVKTVLKTPIHISKKLVQKIHFND